MTIGALGIDELGGLTWLTAMYHCEQVVGGGFMIKVFGALALAALSVQASAEGTLIPSGKFFCRAETFVFCEPSGSCSKHPSKISIVVDFANSTVASLTTGNSKSYIKDVDAKGDVIVFSSAIGTAYTIREVQQGGSATYDFKVLAFLGSPLIHFGTCSRLP